MRPARRERTEAGSASRWAARPRAAGPLRKRSGCRCASQISAETPVCVRVYVRMCTCVCVHACVHVLTCVCLYACARMCVCVNRRACTYVSVRTHVHVYECMHVHMCAYMPAHAHSSVCRPRSCCFLPKETVDGGFMKNGSYCTFRKGVLTAHAPDPSDVPPAAGGPPACGPRPGFWE
uniref:Uncharacterized protein n=1 Tax=Myotis myotis TaxID=51298 RepID=A0A7J7QWS5_MYOMY|nr:hypothetical protein mMyoMyo1_011276 [Myotis myotis]